MSSSHIKRLMMPRSWPLPRKTTVWVQKPDPCGHSTLREEALEHVSQSLRVDNHRV